jgi:hypothetical protein
MPGTLESNTDGDGHVTKFNPDGSINQLDTLATNFYNTVSSSSWAQSIKEMTQPAREALHEALPNVDFFDSNELVTSRDATAQELGAEQALENAYAGSAPAERLTDGHHPNADGSSYEVKDGKITSFKTSDGKSYSDIKYIGKTDQIASMTLPDGSRLAAEGRDNGITDMPSSYTGYTRTTADGRRYNTGYESATVSSAGLVTTSGNRLSLQGMDGSTATMTVGKNGTSETLVKTPGHFRMEIDGTVPRRS